MSDTLQQFQQAALPPPPATPAAGTLIGHYRILDRLGEGGMGQVLLAEHVQLGRRVALKILNPEWNGHRDVVRRFIQEAQLVNKINHEHIVEAYDFGEAAGGQVYCVMELLSGGDLLRVRSEQGPFPLERTLKIARQACAALAAAHAHKVVHRDLKPENVFLTLRGEDPDFVKVLDFGIAKLLESHGASSGTTGMILGTPEYMSPEQAAGARIDWRSDIYSFGLLLYWMLADRLPYLGATYGELLVERQTKPPPPLPERTASGQPIPPALARTVMGCLERDPNDRIQTMAELLAKLDVPMAPSVRPTLRLGRWAAAALGLAVAGALAFGWNHRQAAPVAAPPAHMEIAEPAPPPAAAAAALPEIPPKAAEPKVAAAPRARRSRPPVATPPARATKPAGSPELLNPFHR